ncbi:MAG: hypothetical protein L0241_06730 [Planctomycetia bacterium]|nr:hypothetical protein [Planctomycetia bacterium]
MPELRLIMCQLNEAQCAGVARRLRGAVVEPCADFSQFHTLSGVRDVVMLGGKAELALIERMLSGGRHVLLLANPCPTSEVIEVLSDRARSEGVQFAVVNPERYLPSRQLIRKQLGGPLGEAGLIRLHRWDSSTSPEAPGLPDPLVRDLDLTLWLAGKEPNRVFAIEQKFNEEGRYLQVHLGFPTGAMALLDYTNPLPSGESYQSLSVIAATGAAHADDHQNMQLLYRGGFPQALRTEERAGQLAALAQEFVDALREGRDLSTSSEWKTVFAVADAVERSLELGKAIALEDR